jgi:hypothetical protein
VHIAVTPELEERMRRVTILLESRHDYLPSVRVTDLGDAPGPAAARRVPCEPCETTGRIRHKRGKRFCPSCDGHGWRKARKGDQEWDEYTEAPLDDVQTGVAGVVSIEADVRRLTASIERIDRLLALKQGHIDAERFGWERALHAQLRAGSYRELERALHLLREGFPHLHAVLVAATANALPRAVSVAQQARQELAVAFLAHTMRGPIRVPSWLMYERSVSKLPTIEALHAEGRTAPQIAKRLGMSKSKVKSLLKRRKSVDNSRAGV